MPFFTIAPKLLLNFLATFARNFVPTNFQKSPNLVTLHPSSPVNAPTKMSNSRTTTFTQMSELQQETLNFANFSMIVGKKKCLFGTFRE